jgi:hypothetical protein
MSVDCLSPWRSELVQRCQDLLKAIAFVEDHDRALRLDIEKQKNEGTP